jgi:hypothetical protein
VLIFKVDRIQPMTATMLTKFSLCLELSKTLKVNCPIFDYFPAGSNRLF